MRIAYLLHWNAGVASGVFKKVISQVQCWSNSGATVAVFILSRQDTRDAWTSKAGEIAIFFQQYQGFLNRLQKIRELVANILEWNPEIVYHRYDLGYSSIGSLAKIIPLVLEINTDDIGQSQSLGQIHRYWYNRLMLGRLLSRVKGIVFVSSELAEKPFFASYSGYTTVIGNGINLSEYQTLPPPNNPNPHLVFIGTARQPWSGVDKIIQLAKFFSDWHFDLIGIEPGEFNGQLPVNVSAHGLLERSEYNSVVAKADVAIGTLALHRKSMNEACPLKVREYLAYGIPAIVGYQDTDFSTPVPYLLQISNTPTNVFDFLPDIKNFVKDWKGKRVERNDVANIDITGKEKTRLLFFKQVVEN